MNNTSVHRLSEFGQSIWLDNISRSMVESGKLRDMISLGLRGMTSNPTIFDKSIRMSNDYDAAIEKLYNKGRSIFQIYDELTIKDVQDAADIFRPVYDNTKRLDGYVSLEVDPKLAHDAEKTVEEVRRLQKKVDRENVMFKVPATEAGFSAIEELLAEGININSTLIFSVEQYERTAQAYLKGIKRLTRKQDDLSKIGAVASIFVSRIDTAIDRIIDEKKLPYSLRGKAAVANSKLIYKSYLDIFSRGEFKILERKGARPQRVLWASTSTKDPTYSDIKYVTELIAKETVNTLPGHTLEAFLDHGVVKEALTEDIKDALDIIERLRELGIDIDEISHALLRSGIKAFEDSFGSLLAAIDKKAAAVCKRR